ncbi:hypothetical protein M0812_07544 [Anaeramoeba flamelloides]|uniref:Uncharacterized protein n=1 Tax=Anaeramoeba flamelloides TaxID=1746091 RepID=A0AAV7ZZ85_9EUKA|nr:hypothetical protein M0812_07544 [Anaeramoeba flamelloides]
MNNNIIDHDHVNNNCIKNNAVHTKKKIVINRIQKPPKQNIRKSLSTRSPIKINKSVVIKETGKENFESRHYYQYLNFINPHKKLDCESIIRLLLFEKQLKIS